MVFEACRPRLGPGGCRGDSRREGERKEPRSIVSAACGEVRGGGGLCACVKVNGEEGSGEGQ